MQDRTLFCDVDLFTPEHRIDSRLQTGFFGQLNQQPERFLRDEILRVIQVNAQSLNRETFTSLGIVSKEIPEMCFPNLLRVSFESLPRAAFDDRYSADYFHPCCHFSLPFASSCEPKPFVPGGED